MSRTIIVSNRVPVPSNTGAQAGGLAVVLRDLLERQGGVWFGWSGQVSDDQTLRSIDAGKVHYATIDLTRDEHDGYYNGFSNGVLWPLLHMMPGLVTYTRDDAEMYNRVSERFADALAPLIEPDDIIWVQDYHLFPLPAALRARGIHNAIGFFLHIPFPPGDILSMVPGMDKLVRHVLSADLLGFQTRRDAQNFEAAALSMANATEAGPGLLAHDGTVSRVDVFPVEIDPLEFAELAGRTRADDASVQLHASLHGQHLLLGVDRLDPSKGLPERLEGFGRLLERHPEWRGRVTFLQIAASSRSEVEAYISLRSEIEVIAGRINSDFGLPHWTPIRLITRACDRDTVAGYMRQARVALVTPLRDGMNVVAKEFVAAQDPADPGVLILSRFAGAAAQLTDALLVNPTDPDAITDALDLALRMDRRARQAQWGALWNAIKDRSAGDWGASFIEALAQARNALQAAADRVTINARTPAPSSAVGAVIHELGHYRNTRTL